MDRNKHKKVFENDSTFFCFVLRELTLDDPVCWMRIEPG